LLRAAIRAGRFDVAPGVEEALTDACGTLKVTASAWYRYPLRTRRSLAQDYLDRTDCARTDAKGRLLASVINLELGRDVERRTERTAGSVAASLCETSSPRIWCTRTDIRRFPTPPDRLAFGAVDELRRVTCIEVRRIVARSLRTSTGLRVAAPWKCRSIPAPKGVNDSVFFRCSDGPRSFRAVVAG
jgi:hypothetical protein